MFPTSKGLAAELEASAYLVVGGTSIGVNIPSRARRVMFVSHAADVEARAAEGAVCELVTASLRSRCRMTIPRRLLNVSYHSETSGCFVTYFMVAHVGLFVGMSCCGEVYATGGDVREREKSSDATA